MNTIEQLFDCYNKGFEPPKILDKSLMKFCKVFYHNEDSLQEIL